MSVIFRKEILIMKKIHITDLTLCAEQNERDHSLGFKEKIAIAKQLDRMKVDCIDLGKIVNTKTDPLLISTIAPLLKNSAISLTVGFNEDEIETACKAVASAAKSQIKLSVPVSIVGMEYICHKKPAAVLDCITKVISKCKESVSDIEFCAEDATRAENDFLISAVKAALSAGATSITLCDSASIMMPSEVESFIAELIASVPEISKCELNYTCTDATGLAVAASFAAIHAGATGIKTSAFGNGAASVCSVSEIMRSRGDFLGISSNLDYTVVSTSVKQIRNTVSSTGSYYAEKTENTENLNENEFVLDKNDDITSVSAAIRKLGYDLNPDDEARVYESFSRLVEKKKVNARELDAIVASTAMQVPSTYKLISYIINSGNIINASAHITLEKNGEKLEGITVGDGPIDASFLALEQIIGHHYELDDFQIQSVTEGHEAMGNALVRLRSGGKIYSGNGISTDIIGASIRAYISALNKIIYEEAEK